MAAAECQNEGPSLKDVFEQGFFLHGQIEDSDEPSNSEVFQVVFSCFIWCNSAKRLLRWNCKLYGKDVTDHELLASDESSNYRKDDSITGTRAKIYQLMPCLLTYEPIKIIIHCNTKKNSTFTGMYWFTEE